MVGQSSGAANQPAVPAPDAGGESLPPADVYGTGGLPLPIPPSLAEQDANAIQAAVDQTAANMAAGNTGNGALVAYLDSQQEQLLMQQASNAEPTVKVALSTIAAIATMRGGPALLAALASRSHRRSWSGRAWASSRLWPPRP